ncbi:MULTISPECIES: phosphatase PAP2 family protein [Aeromonas]|uniref:phosphatase PAP2 family protein n=1 Tax=Aeromonas TaxID=642 RepID=UPI001C2214D4|nr:MULTISPECIES: phosphatase PAP2 family protein [Aeromonas]MEB6607111.1 phosphatase PAP2 family protein [Aeromonas sanarellii]QXC30626.1 phosphatase PAP2 family protein [Aeromonas sp. FDAARGOS 1409]QXW30360.1 phosphatase PAP2 family protein [Aeromonas sanarellii]WOX49114.1 phosphatase PAP2 family protein [Aeromonas sp. XH]
MSKFIPLYLIGGLIAFSWAALPDHGPWDHWDLALFQLVNGWLGHSPRWADLVAITNNRLFDLAALACMGGILATCFFRAGEQDRRRLVAMGCVMLLAALVINQLGHLLPVSRPSPTLMVEGALRLTELSTIPTKDSAGDSFPGDHALFLMIFAGFTLRYLPRRAAMIALLMVPLFSAPRILAGAHWMTDVYVGALCLSLICLPPLLLSPLSDRLIDRIAPRLPRWIS